MHFLIVGCNGQLGTDMMKIVRLHGHTVKGIDYPELDIANDKNVDDFIKLNPADILINCSGYTVVDECETHKREAFKINTDGVANLATSTNNARFKFVHISTDYVFNGNKLSAYVESDIPDPQSIYGCSKLAGEYVTQINSNHQIFRIAWLYGCHGNNFVKTIRSIAKKNALTNTPIKVVNDQIGSPTYTRSVCEQILVICELQETGIFHCTNEGSCSWFDFAQYIIKKSNIDVNVIPCSTKEFPRLAKRPANSVLENERIKKLNLSNMPHWSIAFDQFLKDEQSKC